MIKLADELREKKIKIGFFSSTPQGGKRRSTGHRSMISPGLFSRWCRFGLSFVEEVQRLQIDRVYVDATCLDQVPDSTRC